MIRLSSILALAVALLFTGCANYHTRIAPGMELSKYRKIFVENNLSDNHRIEFMIVDSLKALGLEAENGPPTLQPADTDAILRYSDHWTWDFSEHITGLDLELIDARHKRPVGGAYFSGSLSMKTKANEIVDRLVRELFNRQKGKK